MGRSRNNDTEAALARALAAGMAEGERRAFERVLIASAEEIFGTEAKDVSGFIDEVGAEKALPLITEAAQTVWPNRYREVLTPVLSAMMGASAAGAAPVLGSFTLRNPKMREAFTDYVTKLGRDLSETSRKRAIDTVREGIDEGLSNPNIALKLREQVAELSPARATLVARTETTRAANTASLIQARESGVVKGKRWLATNDDRTREEHAAMDGEEVGIDEVFSNGEESPGSPNCRCSLQFIVDLEAVRGGAA